MMTRSGRTLLILLTMLGVGFAAFGLPQLLYRDYAPTALQGGCVYWGSQPCTVAAIRRLKTQAARGYKLRPEFSQVTDLYLLGDTPNDVQGTVVWRTLFGIPVAERRIAGAGSTSGLNWLNWVLAWAIFLLVEGVLGILLFWGLLEDG